jgi:hypothetical protein
MLIGYNRAIAPVGRRFSGVFLRTFWKTIPTHERGDHCMDYTLVPGVLLSNRLIDASNPARLISLRLSLRSSGLSSQKV